MRTLRVFAAGFFACAGAFAMSDSEWESAKRAYLAKPRRVMIDDDGCDAANFPEKKPITVGNFYGFWLDRMVGHEFDVLVYCPVTTGFMVTNRTRTGHRYLNSLTQLHYTNITETLEREFDTDPLQLAHDFARSNGYEFVVNMRVNDAHDAFFPSMLSDYKKSNPGLLVGDSDKRPPIGDWSAFDFAQPEVRRLFRTIVCEWFDRYDPDGLMIDLKSNVLFKSVAWGGKPTSEECAALTALLKDLRAYAEHVGRVRGRPIYFMFRVPDSLEICHLCGVELEKWADEGLFDFCIAGSDCGHYRLMKDAAEFCRDRGLRYYASVDVSWLKTSSMLFKRNCHEMFTGLFSAAYAAGADGVYMFNMFYSADYFPEVRRDSAGLAFLDKKYFVTTHVPWKLSAFQPREGERGLRRLLYPEYPLVLSGMTAQDFALEVGDDFAALPAGGPRSAVRLCLQTSAERSDELVVRLNGIELAAETLADSVAVYPVVPSVVKKGVNRLTIAAAHEMKPVKDLLLSGDELLNASNRRRWRRLFPGNAAEGAERIADGAYRLESGDSGAVNLLYPIGNGCGQPLETEFSLKVEADSQPGGVCARLANGQSVELVDFMPDRVRLRYSAHQTGFNTLGFHDYRIRLADGKADLFADGRLILSGEVGRNARNPAFHLKGQNYRVAGMDESSLLIGAVDPVAGASCWKNVSLTATSLAVSDAMLEVKFRKQGENQ